jgi:phage terminase large subunit-like protein
MVCEVREKTKYHFSRKRADHAIYFIEHLQHTNGRWAGQYFKLLPWQRQIITDVFGTLKADNTRRYRTVYIEMPKKNGKSDLAAGIALYLLAGDNEPGAEVYGAACDKEQAAIVYNVASQMVKMSPALSKRLKVRDSVKRIIYPKTNSFYRVISSDVKTKHGFNTHGVVFDELHAQPNRQLWDVLTEGAGAARRQPLFFVITTAGVDRNSICWELHERARRILTGQVKPEDDPTFYPVIYGPPDDEAGKEWDWEDEDNWKAVNPSLGETIQLEDMREDFKQAQLKVEKENLFKQLRLNIWVKQSIRWIRLSDWDKCVGKIDLEELKGRGCYGSLDLSSSNDLTAEALVFPFPDQFYKVLMRFWIPQDLAIKKEERDHVPYTRWIHEGFITPTPGNLIDYQFIRQRVNEDRAMFDLQELCYDSWGAVRLITDFREDGFVDDEKLACEGHPLLIPFRQGYKSMSPPSKELINVMLNCKLEHGNNPVLRWNADNAVIEMDAAGNIKPDKAKATQRIDGIVALIMALDRAMRHANIDEKSVYETRGPLIYNL